MQPDWWPIAAWDSIHCAVWRLFRRISWSLEAAKLDVIMTDIAVSAVPAKFQSDWKSWISRLRDFTRSCRKTSYRSVNRIPAVVYAGYRAMGGQKWRLFIIDIRWRVTVTLPGKNISETHNSWWLCHLAFSTTKATCMHNRLAAVCMRNCDWQAFFRGEKTYQLKWFPHTSCSVSSNVFTASWYENIYHTVSNSGAIPRSILRKFSALFVFYQIIFCFVKINIWSANHARTTAPVWTVNSCSWTNRIL